MKKRTCLLLSIMLVMTFCFSAYGAKTTVSAKSKSAEKVELGMYLNNQSDTSWLNFYKTDVIGKFEKDHPNIKINLSLNADPTGTAKQQLAAGGGPDIVALDGPSTLQLFAGANYLLPLDKYAKKYGWEQYFNKWALDTVKRDGKIMGAPDAHETVVVYYNKKMFTDNGWKIPTNYTQLMDLCKKIKAKNVIPFAFGSSDFKQANEWWLSVAFNETIGAANFKKILKGEVKWNSPGGTEAIQKLSDMWKNGYIYENSAGITLDDATNLFATGKAAMKMEGTWLLSNLITKKLSFDWGMFTMPSWKDGVEANLPLALGAAVGININSKHPDEAAEFINWSYDKTVSAKQLKYGTFESVNGINLTSSSDVDKHIKDAYGLLNAAIKSNKTGYAAWTYWPPNAETYAWSNIESLYLGQVSLKDYMDKLEKAAEKDKAKNNLFKFSN